MATVLIGNQKLQDPNGTAATSTSPDANGWKRLKKPAARHDSGAKKHSEALSCATSWISSTFLRRRKNDDESRRFFKT